MKIILTRRQLKAMSTGFGRIITGRTGLPILACVRFQSDKGTVTATATDLDQTAIHALDRTTAEGQGDIIVPLDLLKRLSKGNDRESVTFENDGCNVLVTNHVGSHDVQQTVTSPDPEDWPPEGGAIRTAPAPGLITAYRKLVAFASTDETRLVLNSVYADVSGNEASLVATDGRRLAVVSGLDLARFKTNAVIPVTKFLQWNQLPDDAEAGAVKTDKQVRICVKAGAWTYRVKAIDGQYPNYRQVIPSGSNPAHRISFPEGDINSLVKVIEAFPGDEYITFNCRAEDGITLHGKDREGVNDLNVPINGGSSYSGSGCSVTIDRSFLLDALGAGFTEYAFDSGHSPLLSVNGSARHVLMPMRVDESAATENSEPEQQSETTTTEQAAAETPETAPVTTKERKPMAMKDDTPSTDSTEPTAFERLLASFEIAKAKVKEAQTALGDVAADIRNVAKEERLRRREVESVRAGLQKLQSIQV